MTPKTVAAHMIISGASLLRWPATVCVCAVKTIGIVGILSQPPVDETWCPTDARGVGKVHILAEILNCTYTSIHVV